jgi:hypothetical protein
VSRVISGVALVVLGCTLSMPLAAQLPLTSAKSSGDSVSPAYEGWYKNPDGTYTLSFGYYNRNTNEVIEIPIGKNNFVSPGTQNQGQPSESFSHAGIGACLASECRRTSERRKSCGR